MNPWPLLIAVIGYNYTRHKQGKSTLCSTGREHIPAPAFVAGWGCLTCWLVPHFCQWRKKA